MAAEFGSVELSEFTADGELRKINDSPLQLKFDRKEKGEALLFQKGEAAVRRFHITSGTEWGRMGASSVSVRQKSDGQTIVIRFKTEAEIETFENQIEGIRKGSLFDQRTDVSSAVQYFQFYGYLSQQQNMMQDYIRTATFQRAMLSNLSDFKDKIVLDVGAGSGILSFFAVQAGAKKVYAIEASNIAEHCRTLVDHNNLNGRIQVIPGRVEEVHVPELVDIIISEPMGYMLFNERMLETYIHARKWLKPNGLMFPTTGDLHIAPFTDDALHMEQFSKANFWYQQSFHGVDLTSLRRAAIEEYFKQPIVDTFDVRICMSRSQKFSIDFLSAAESDLHVLDIPVSFNVLTSGTCHGLAFWFETSFKGTSETIWLSTSPTEPLTHWYQVRCLLEKPVLVKAGQTISGSCILRCNTRQSYDVEISIGVDGSNVTSSNVLDLKNPFFRYTGQPLVAPPGNSTSSPTDQYWSTVTGDCQGGGDLYSYMNGGMTQNMQHNGDINAGNGNGAAFIPIAANNLINSGSIPSIGSFGQTLTSVGGGISPSSFFPAQAKPVTNQANTATTTKPASSGGGTWANAAPQGGANASGGGGANPQMASFPVANQFMIADYVVPGNVVQVAQPK